MLSSIRWEVSVGGPPGCFIERAYSCSREVRKKEASAVLFSVQRKNEQEGWLA